MKHAASQTLYAYWNALRGTRAIPDCDALDPVAIGSILADTFLVDIEPREGPDAFSLRVRLSGTRINALAGRDLAGSDLLTLWLEQDRARLQDLLLAVLEEARVVVAGCVAGPVNEHPARLEALFLPLRHHNRADRQVLGALSTVSSPPWLGLKEVGPISLSSERVIDPLDLQPAASLLRERWERRLQLTVYEGGTARVLA